MKKTKKFNDGGSTGGRFVDMGESRVFVPDTPAPIAAGLAGMQDGPRAEAQLAGLGTRMAGQGPIGAGIGPGLSDTAGGFQDNMDRPDVTARPMGLMMPPPNRRIGVRGAVPGTYASSMGGMAAGMKKGGAVKKMAKGGSTSSASKRADGCAVKGKTKGRFV
jgi:hypothetical protein